MRKRHPLIPDFDDDAAHAALQTSTAQGAVVKKAVVRDLSSP